jgi:hypothetical protein
MTAEQMRDLDRNLDPYTMLTPFFFWLSEKKLEWIRLNPSVRCKPDKIGLTFRNGSTKWSLGRAR